MNLKRKNLNKQKTKETEPTKASLNLNSKFHILTSDHRGITLIALVITIIVMLILVTVTIRVATEGNLFRYAGNAVKETKNAVYNENYLSDGQIKVGGEGFDIEGYVASKTEDDDGGPSATPGEKVTVKTAYTSNGKTAQIPAGFAVSGIASEQSIDNGLVIYYQGTAESIDWTDPLTARKTYDQFVWIPVDEPESMFICRGKTVVGNTCQFDIVNGVAKCTVHNSTDIAGRLYATSMTSTGETFPAAPTNQSAGTWNSGLREPDVVSSDSSNNIVLENATSGQIDLKEEYNQIAKSVIENKGFWVGRYETTKMNGTAQVVAGETSGIDGQTWYTMFTKQKALAKGEDHFTYMITGATYDQVMLFVNGKTKYLNGTTVNGTYNVKATNQVGHNLSNLYQTGCTNYSNATAYNDMVCNIYDLEGNVFEWTTEALDSGWRVIRGGNCGSNYSASYREGKGVAYAFNGIGSRCALFVK